MPKVKSLADKQAAIINNAIQGATQGKHNQLADVWQLSRQAVDYRIKNGRVTLLDLWKARNVIDLDALDIERLVKERGK